MSNDQYDDPFVQAKWLQEQRDTVLAYLQTEGVRHSGVPEQQDWFVAPHVSLWRVGSMVKLAATGWWAISGDLPTDYISGRDASDARGALRAFARQWFEASEYMLRGEDHPTMKIGNPGNRRELGDLLRRRAAILETYANEDANWR